MGSRENRQEIFADTDRLEVKNLAKEDKGQRLRARRRRRSSASVDSVGDELKVKKGVVLRLRKSKRKVVRRLPDPAVRRRDVVYARRYQRFRSAAVPHSDAQAPYPVQRDGQNCRYRAR